jgi:hypothetical protein
MNGTERGRKHQKRGEERARRIEGEKTEVGEVDGDGRTTGWTECLEAGGGEEESGEG